MKKEQIKVTSEAEAWKLAKEIFAVAYELDKKATENAGYKIYRALDEYDYAHGQQKPWISDLGNRLELNMANGETINIWIEEPVKTYTAAEVKAIVTRCKKEIEAAELLLASVSAMDLKETDVGQDVDMLLRGRMRKYQEQLAEFGL